MTRFRADAHNVRGKAAMCDQHTYELRLKHCPCGCGYEVTARAAGMNEGMVCPRCKGAAVADFRDNGIVPISVQAIAGAGTIMRA